MFRCLSNFLLMAVALRSATAAIDFTPLVKEYTRQGMVYRQVTLKDDKADITFVPPQGWTVRGVSARLQLSPPHSNLAEATVEAASLPGPQPFDEKTTKVIEQQVVNSAPPGSQAVQTQPVGCGILAAVEEGGKPRWQGDQGRWRMKSSGVKISSLGTGPR